MKWNNSILLLALLCCPTLQAGGLKVADPKVSQASLEETKQILQELVAINTSNPPGNEMKAIEYLRPFLEQENIEVKVFESAPGRGNLWARIKKTKRGGTEKPLLLMAHLDVVGAKQEDWKTDPFKMVEAGGYYYGRGVIDDKGMAAASITVFKLLAQNKVPLDRDIILFLGADEESGSDYGMLWMLKKHPELLKADVAINEGGPIVIEKNRISYAAIQNYEKIYLNVGLVAEGPSGHSSLPKPDNAVVRISKAVAQIGAYQFPMKLNDVTRAYFEGLSRLPDHPLQKEFALISGEGTKQTGEDYQQALKKIVEVPAYNAALRTTCTPTIVTAGFRENAIPGKAEANINCRILPTDDPHEVVATLKKVVDDPQVGFTLKNKLDKIISSPFKHPIFAAVQQVMSELAPGSVTIPYMTASSTDSLHLRLLGINAYGLLPFPLTPDDKARMHGNDERMPVASLGFGVEFLYRLVLAFAGGTN